MSDPKRITHVLAFMDYNNLSEKEEELIVSFTKQFEKKKSLSDEQVSDRYCLLMGSIVCRRIIVVRRLSGTPGEAMCKG